MIQLKEFMKRVDVFLHPEDCMRDAIWKMLCSKLDVIPVVDQTGKFLGAITRNHLLQMVLQELPLHTPIQNHYQQEDAAFVVDASFKKIQEKICYSHTEMIFVLGQERRVIGFLLKADIIRYLFFQNREMETIIEQGNDGLVLVDEEGKINFVNQKMLELFSCSKEDLLGQSIDQRLPQLKLKEAMKTGRPDVFGWFEENGILYQVHRLPVLKDGKVTGVIGKVVFRHLDQMGELFEKLDRKKDSKRIEKHQPDTARFTWKHMISSDPEVERLKRCAKKAAKGDSTILIRGESGTGKELIAHAIHRDSRRRNGPFITINCAAVPEHLMEAEFFGYNEGAFTGAGKKGKPGKLELADGGTLFLDEIGDMSLKLQAKLLRVFEEKSFYRVGGTRRIYTDVRIIAATNQSLEEMMEKGAFREDLFYRLNVIAFKIPPLRKRKQDILPICRQFIKELNQKRMTSITGMTPEVIRALMNYDWPGNVRELKNVLERAMIFAEHGSIRLEDLPAFLRDNKHTSWKQERGLLEQAEKNAIRQALYQTEGNKVRAARLLGVSRSVLYEKLKKYQLME